MKNPDPFADENINEAYALDIVEKVLSHNVTVKDIYTKRNELVIKRKETEQQLEQLEKQIKELEVRRIRTVADRSRLCKHLGSRPIVLIVKYVGVEKPCLADASGNALEDLLLECEWAKAHTA